MDKFIVSARKYRPQNFNTVIGQSHITTTLKNAIKNNQLAHAFLFCGPRGVGKTTCARILAKTINCENKTPDGEACNTCNSCVSFDNGTSLNIHELDAASNNSVDDIRTLVEQIRFAPQAGKYKVYIVDEVHMLSTSAFNAFLKTLEEPPPFAIFILATTEKHKILPTILSRCQIFDFKRITNQDTVDHLREICEKENINADDTALHVIAQKSEGCLRDALSILDKIVSFTNGELTYANTLEHLNILDEDYYFRFMDAMQNQSISDAILLYDEINRKGFEGDLVLNGFAEFIRNLLVSKDPKVAMLLEVSEGFKQRYLDVALKANASLLLSALNILNEAEINYRQARNKRLHVELTLIKLCYIEQAIELVNEGDHLNKKKQVESMKPVAFKALTPIAFKEKAPQGNKVSENIRAASGNKKNNIQTPEDKAKLIIEEKLVKPIIPKASADHTRVANGRTHTKIGRLEKIQEQVALENKQNENNIKELNEEELYVAWGLYIEELRKKNNHSGVTNFKSAKLGIVDNNCIEIITDNNIQQKFIETERAALIEHLQAHFNNRFLTYKVIVIENENKVVLEKPLTTKDQYLKIIEEYPLIKQLKDRLGLQLDY
ncbi:DNA polymerase III subunit gamma/tau [Ginsengibacter hankyongi]|uniref:DNA polymerase III subunit gamma/tau n=1 Tax=Ginsengibacter hankyongi TaxID=2607284 RepID=A0A5J5ILA0_9BACT|nr:DNA polymerase III subunit gamma/tau [Ginsengibacter hankyongi]KAA9041856.1 DNA polymerase III subunit gamma/tau [Ginsengibacter hankyongi]